MTSRIWRIDLRYDPVLDEGGAQSLADKLKIPRSFREKCDRSVRKVPVDCDNDCMDDWR